MRLLELQICLGWVVDQSKFPLIPTSIIEVPLAGERDVLRGEKETLGLYLTGHP